MQPWTDISPVSGFPEAFYAANARLAGHVTALGEIVTLPIVLLVTVQVQPRLMRAMSVDGLLSPWFQQLDDSGNLWNGICFSGVLLILFSTFVPFKYLNDTVSCAVLATLIMTNSSLLLMWHEDPQLEIKSSNLAEQLILLFHAAAIFAAWSITQNSGSNIGILVSAISVAVMVAITLMIYWWCPRSIRFGGRRHHPYHHELVKTETGYFETPLVPFWPCLAIFVNWILIAQLEFTGIMGLLIFWFVVILYYMFFAVHNSVGGKTNIPNPKRMPEVENMQLME
jgi:APA family basic amino acid/polyamine antiporter